MSKKIDIKNALKAKFSVNDELVKIQGIESLGIDLYVKHIKTSTRMKMADKAQEYYNIDPKEIKLKKMNVEDIKVSSESQYRYLMFMISVSVCDEDGELIFDSEEETCTIIDNFPDTIFQLIIETINEVNGIGDESVKKPLADSDSMENEDSPLV